MPALKKGQYGGNMGQKILQYVIWIKLTASPDDDSLKLVDIPTV